MKEHVLWPELQVERGKRALGGKAGQGGTRLLMLSCHVEEFGIYMLDSRDWQSFFIVALT